MNKCNRCGRFRNQNHICNPIKVLKSDGKTVDYYFTLGKSKLPKSLKKPTRNIKKKNRLLKGLTVGITSLVLTVWSCNALANFDMTTLNSVVYQKSTTTPTMTTAVVQPSESIKEKILRYSLKYDVNPQEIENIVKCETGATDVNEASTTIRSRYLEGTPRHERSWGLAQIWLTGHPDVTYEQAIDPDFALDFLAKNWKQHKQWWACAKLLGI